ncbi:MAG: GFA family protein [Tropicimonas sp.]|uniref:GFA family protein n=1 Tax=Tropicimonas sp. TaxID=2067044 RepID=UPI003A87473B
MGERLAGRCLCGACTFTAEPAKEAGICHCSMCRRWSGGMFMGVDCGSSLEFAEGAPVVAYRSSEWGRRLFCGQCGSTLAWQMADGSHSHVSMQSFDDPGAFIVASEIFIDEKPANYALANQTTKMTGAEVLAMFAAQPGGDQ